MNESYFFEAISSLLILIIVFQIVQIIMLGIFIWLFCIVQSRK